MADEPVTIATRTPSDHPCPTKRATLNLSGTYSETEYEQIKAGFIPNGMDDKWFMFFEAPWLYVHRSWTGFCIFGVRFEASPEGASIVESWASRDETQHPAAHDEYDPKLLQYLIDAFLANRPVRFPFGASPLTQHILVGRVVPDTSE